ncbi:hypothetical protein ES708_22274 [subsurface metagenome]
MSKRIFTKFLDGYAIDTSQVMWNVENAIDSWLVQEDIEVIGFQLGAKCHSPDQNDDLAEVVGELSQTGVYAEDGAMGQVVNASLWNSVPQGIDRECPTTVVMFPQGTAIPVKEEGHLYLNAQSRGANGTHTTWVVWAIVFYTKKGSR